jgi:hypothetical protein
MSGCNPTDIPHCPKGIVHPHSQSLMMWRSISNSEDRFLMPAANYIEAVV